MPYILADLERVRRIAGIENNQLSDEEVEEYMEDVSDKIYDDFGRPLAKVETLIYDNFYTYDLTRQKRRIFSIEFVSVAGSTLGAADYTAGLQEGTITLGSSIVESNLGQRLVVEYIPRIFSQYANFLTAQKCLAALLIVAGDETSNPRMQYINSEVEMLGSRIGLGGQGAIMSSEFEKFDPRRPTPVFQDILRRFG